MKLGRLRGRINGEIPADAIAPAAVFPKVGKRVEESTFNIMSSCVDGVSQLLLDALDGYRSILSVSGSTLQEITDRFIFELEEGLSKNGGNIPMNPAWVLDYPTGKEKGHYLAIDLGGTNLRVVLVYLDGNRDFTTELEKFALPDDIRTQSKEELWLRIAGCLKTFFQKHFPEGVSQAIPLGFTFSFPCTQYLINEGILQRWTKGWDIDGIEGEDVVPMLQAEIERLDIPIEVVAVINDTTGTLVASAYTDPSTKMGLIYGTGCNGAYYETCGDIPKLDGRTHDDISPDTLMAINCEYGAFDNDHVVLPRTKFDIEIDDESPRPGQQAFEKMISGYYLGEVLRKILLEMKKNGLVFKNQETPKLNEAFIMDASYPSAIEEDQLPDLSSTATRFKNELGITTTFEERQVMRQLSELIGIRLARLLVCGVAAACKKRGYTTAHCAADGSLYNKYPHFGERAAKGLRDIFEWGDIPDPITITHAEDGLGVGAAVIAALTQKRLAENKLVGVKN